MPDYPKVFRGTQPSAQHIDWAEVETRLGIPLPADYREYAESYPAANIDNFLNVPHPSCTNDAPNLVG
ncbi:hypothetical protein [Amycolatopsis sp. FDAARGOS 1241]|uniref:hypothetical protein n=1 Tax=Amycolatopsis sp. FDAARGOS 1241 TaxID=2778070 RepID=UPI001950720C|nr:hypothetical protein [Amycolatopsis sp. FDAARGOS 1241]QRP45732.1 hypothetical protein I6J71_42695 [Amycolatopsis sp. FDAARGOS 1241]